MSSSVSSAVFLAVFGSTLALVATGCGASKKDVKTALDSGYDTDFANVYSVALDTLRKYYPHLEENATTGVIKTSWHPVRNLSAADDPLQSDRPVNNTDPIAAVSGRQVHKLYFVRFAVYVVGGNPWRVRIDSEASEWSAGGVPTPLSGANVPPWLKGRTNALRVEMHRKLARYAVKLDSTAVIADADKPEDKPVIEVDQSYLGALPPGALAVVIDTSSAAKARDFTVLAALMWPDFQWSLGAPPSARQAVIMWQADSSVLDRLVAVLEAGCAMEIPDKRAVCPASPGTGYRAVFERGPDNAWTFVSFVSQD